MSKAKVLILDIETAPMIAYVWKLWENDVSLDMLKSDWHVLAWSAKWLGEKEVMYADQRNAKNIEDDKKLLEGIWKLMDEAQVIVTQNGRAFDLKRLNARFIINGMKPPSSYKSVDTKVIASTKFGFTSNKLEYMTDKLCTKYKKLKHEKFSGFSLWEQCLKGNKAAWREMEKYNKYDVLSLEELFTKLAPWAPTYNPNLYTEGLTYQCTCGSSKLHKNGYAYTATGKYQRFSCADCGAEVKGRENSFTSDKRKSIRR